MIMTNRPSPDLIWSRVVVAGLLIAGAHGEFSQKANAQAPGIPSVTVTPVSTAKVAETAKAIGRTQAVEDVELLARVEGFLTRRSFTEGADVKAGDLLFTIERAPYEAEVQRIAAELDSAKARLTKAGLDLERAVALRRNDNVSQARVDEATAGELQAKADVLAREAELRRANIDLGYTTIRAPIDGRVGRAEFSVGDLVGPNSGTLATLVQLDPIHVYWGVNEEILLDARRNREISDEPGNPGPHVKPRLQFADGSYYEYAGQVDFLDNRIDPVTGTQTARAIFPNPDRVLLPGQYVGVVLQIGETHDALVVPQAAVQEDQAGRFVLVVDTGNRVSVRRVSLGARQGIHWVVEEGLAMDELVIYQGVQKVRPGSLVDPVIATPSSPGDT